LKALKAIFEFLVVLLSLNES